MLPISVFVYRGSIVESQHKALVLVKDVFNNSLFSTNSESQLIYPRSAIKIFQALPFINSKAHDLFNLSQENIAISCSSHIGEQVHIKILQEWLDKISVSRDMLRCGIHSPIDEQSSNNLFLTGKRPTQLHNNCSGKHLGMISGCLAMNMEIKDYIDYDHPYQRLIRNSLEFFMETKIKDNCIGTDGCSAPQYAFPINNIATSMVNLTKTIKLKNEYSNATKVILKSINMFPFLIGGTNRFDTNIIKSTKGRIFCKGGAEGVLLFSDFSKKIGGVIKVIDGNNRAIPSIAMKLFSKLSMLNEKESKELNHWKVQNIYNHAKKQVGEIVAEALPIK